MAGILQVVCRIMSSERMMVTSINAKKGAFVPLHYHEARPIYAQALVDGKGEEDFSAIVATAEKLSGVKFKK